MRSLRVKVRPNAREQRLEPDAEGGWVARVKAPPVGGRANAELVKLIAREFGLRPRQVRIRHGGSGRTKLVDIDD